MKKELPERLIVFFLLCFILLSGFLYKSSFNAYFFQDDWFTFRISNAKTVFDFFRFFVPRTDVIYYRPLGMQIPFFVLRSVFGINPLPFRILTFITHSINVILVYFLVRLLTKHEIVALLSAFFYSSSAVHYIPFFWSATYAFVLGPTAFFLSFILFLLFLDKKNKSYLIFSLLIFFLGLLINEMIVTLPLIIILYLFIFKKMKFSSYLLSYIFIAVLLFLPRFLFFPPPSKGVYQLGIDRYVLNNLEAYLLWSFNWPEEMKAQLVNFMQINPQFVKDFTWYFWIFIISLFLNVTLLFIIPLITLKKKNKKIVSLFFFGISWFIIGLLPVIFFLQHSFSYYLPISLVGMLLISISLFFNLIKIISRKFNYLFAYILTICLLANWLLVSFVTFDFNSKIHWAPKRARISKKLVDEAKKNYQYPLKDFRIYVALSSENKWALNDQDAFRLIFENDQIVTVYTDGVIKGKEAL